MGSDLYIDTPADNQIGFSKADEVGEMWVTTKDRFENFTIQYINKEQAIQIISHLKKEFSI